MKLPSLNPSSLPALLFLLSLPALVTPLYFHIGETERKCFIEEIPDETMVIGTYARLALRYKGPKQASSLSSVMAAEEQQNGKFQGSTNV